MKIVLFLAVVGIGLWLTFAIKNGQFQEEVEKVNAIKTQFLKECDYIVDTVGGWF